MNKVTDYLSEADILLQLAEEAAELSAAAAKLARKLEGRNPTPKSVEECMESFFEEVADVDVCMEILSWFDDMDTAQNQSIYDVTKVLKKTRWLKRLQEKEGTDNG